MTQPHCVALIHFSISCQKSGPQGGGNHPGGLTRHGEIIKEGLGREVPQHRPCQSDFCRWRSPDESLTALMSKL